MAERRSGYARTIPGLDKRLQIDVLRRGRCWPIYTDRTAQEFVEAAREGDREVFIAGGLCVLADNRKAIREAVDLLKAKGIVVVDLLRDQRSDRDGVAMMHDAVEEIAARSRRGKHLEGRAKEAAQIRWKEKRARVQSPEARHIWFDMAIETNAEAAALIGSTIPTLIRHYGASGRKRGRKPRED